MSKLIKIAGGVLFAATVLTGCTGPMSATSSSSSATATASVGQEVRDGKFAFTVVSVDAPQSTIGDQKAQGQFVAAHLNVKKRREPGADVLMQ
jgi:ABC-type glycerol-3-phosphate transport system substrate-binding protein